MHDRISRRQLSALTGSAACVPVFQVCCRIGWVQAAVGGAGAALLLAGLSRLAEERPLLRAAENAPGRIALSALAASLLVLAGRAGSLAANAFPETEGIPAAGWLTLALAAWAAWQGTAVLGRCAGILLPASLILYCIVLIFSAPQIKPERLTPSGDPLDACRALAVLLVPAAGICLRRDVVPAAPRRSLTFWLTAALAAAAAAVTGGILSPRAAAQPGSFGVLAKSVSILGVMQRFEALVSAALLMSGFCLCGLLLGAAASVIAALAGERRGKALFLLSLPVPAVFAWLDRPEIGWIAGVCSICCGLAAFLLQGIGPQKTSKKIF